MNWSYVAGLFDGEGCVAIANSGGKNSVSVYVRCNLGCSQKLAYALISFLKLQNISTSPYCIRKNHLGITGELHIYGWRNVENFSINVFPFSIEKKESLSLILKATELHTTIKANGDRYIDYMPEFDEIRHAIHAYAKKGSALTEWKYPENFINRREEMKKEREWWDAFYRVTGGSNVKRKTRHVSSS